MALTTTELNYTEIDLCENTTYNDADGTDSVDYKEGSNSVYATLRSSGNNDITFTPASSIDMSGTGVHVRFWGLFAQGQLINNIQLGISDGTNTGYYILETGSTYPGGWYPFVVDVSGSVDSGTKPTSMNAITSIIVRINLSGLGKNFDNTWIDNLIICDGISIYGDDGGGTFDFEDIYTQDNATAVASGTVIKYGGIYYVQGKLQIGDASGTSGTKFSASGQIVIFPDKDVLSTLYGIEVVDNGTGTTEFQLGTKAGTAGVSGCTIGVESLSQTAKWDFDVDDTDVDNFKLYGSTFFGADGMSFPANATGVEILNCQFNDNGLIYGNTAIIEGSNFVNGGADGALEIDSTSHNVEDCNFINCTVAVYIDTAGTYDFQGMNFVGSTNDIENASSATLMDSYQPTEDGDVDVYSGSITRVAQQFTATAGVLSRAIFSIRKQGSPTGDIVAVLYANSGGAPTGTALATSNAVSIAGLTTSFADVEFEFEDEYTVSAQDYHIAIEYSGGDASNRLEVEYLTAGSGSETCNTYISSWGSQTYDCRFAVNRDGIVKINATDSNPSTATESAAVKGATIIQNTVNLYITTIDKNNDPVGSVSCAIFKLSDDTELMNEDSNATTGIATEPFNYPGSPVDIYWRVRESPAAGTRYQAKSGLGQIDANGFSVTVTMELEPVS